MFCRFFFKNWQAKQAVALPLEAYVGECGYATLPLTQTVYRNGGCIMHIPWLQNLCTLKVGCRTVS